MVSQAKQIIRRILHADDSPEKIAWGVALGLFVAFTPTIGIQMIIAGVLAWLLRANQVAAIAVVWITNPYTAIPVYWFNYILGYWIVGGKKVNWKWFVELIEGAEEYGWLEYMQFAYTRLLEVFYPLCVGSVVVGLVWAIVSYPLVVYSVRKYRAFRSRESRVENREM